MLRSPFTLAILLFIATNSSTQEIADYSAPNEYEIGGISVQGTKSVDDVLVRSLCGLRKGMTIEVPGPKISAGIKALWKQKLFSHVDIAIEKQIGDVVFLKILVAEQPRLQHYTLQGIRKMQEKELRERLDKVLGKGAIVSESAKQIAAETIKDYYIDKGRSQPTVQISEKESDGKVALVLAIDPGPRVRINAINFRGNDQIFAKELRSQMTNTRSKKRLLASSKFIKEQFQSDKENIIHYYRQKGYRDAKITADTIVENENGDLSIRLDIREGHAYYFRNIRWSGNALYSDAQLSRALGIAPGDRYNAHLLEERLHFSENGSDVSALYLDRGYLFFKVSAEEVGIEGDQIDFEIKISEGPKATIDKVIVSGNDRTQEDVVRRIIRTKPGDQFSRAAIIRSQREIINLGFFDPEKIEINTPVNPQRGTVDIEYKVTEKSSDQVELSAGYNPAATGGLVGTVGFTFTNISLGSLFGKERDQATIWGGGQRLTLRAQSTGRPFQSYNFSFIEPWLGGKRPNALQVSGYYTRNANPADLTRRFSIAQASVGLAKPMRWPDDYFTSTTSLNFQQINLNNYGGSFNAPDGTEINSGRFNNFYLSQTFARNSISHPYFPTKGSLLSFTMQFTPPYSSFAGDRDYGEMPASELYRKVEYHKWEFNGTWYKQLANRVVLKARANWGVVGSYNRDIGVAPFGLFELGSEPLATQYSLTGKDPITLRGYSTDDFPAVGNGGAAVCNKLSLELRYRLNQSGSMYLLGFADAGNAWSSLGAVKPFDLKRSVGAGFRMNLPMLGTVGVDAGYGFDRLRLPDQPALKLTDLFKFSFILGFEPK